MRPFRRGVAGQPGRVTGMPWWFRSGPGPGVPVRPDPGPLGAAASSDGNAAAGSGWLTPSWTRISSSSLAAALDHAVTAGGQVPVRPAGGASAAAYRSGSVSGIPLARRAARSLRPLRNTCAVRRRQLPQCRGPRPARNCAVCLRLDGEVTGKVAVVIGDVRRPLPRPRCCA